MARNWPRSLAIAKRLFLFIPGLRGVDYGYRYREGIRRKQLCIRFHVAQKLSKTQLPPHEILPAICAGLPCDVVQASYGLQLSPREVCDPLQPGVSIGNLLRGSTGTLGAIVRDNLTGRPALLSNWHVLAGSLPSIIGESICQPGPMHVGSNLARTIGTLERWLPLDHGFDAALALLGAGVAEDDRLFDLGIVPREMQDPQPGMRLTKAGAASGTTVALVDGVDGAFAMDYSGFGDQLRWMDGIRLVHEAGAGPDEISLSGDSGALWIHTETKRAVALHFAGEDGLGPLAEYAVAHPIKKILTLLDASLPA